MKWPWQLAEDAEYYLNAYKHEHEARQGVETKLATKETELAEALTRIVEARNYVMGVEAENINLKAQVTVIEAENINLKSQVLACQESKDKEELTREDVYSELAVELDLLPRVRKMPPGMEYQTHSGHLPPEGSLNKHGIAMLFLEAKALLRRGRELLDRMIGELGAKQDQLVEMAISRRLQIEGTAPPR